jgi:hypothetical protein
MLTTPIAYRIDCWLNYATAIGYKPKRILVHPDDLSAARQLCTHGLYRNLPVETFAKVAYWQTNPPKLSAEDLL